MSVFAEALNTKLNEAKIEYDEKQIAVCERYFTLVKEANRHVNLTRITEEKEAAQRHFLEAALLLRCAALPHGCSVIDVGTGAGFPGVPLKILRPDIKLTLLDSSGKKTDFIKTAADECGIEAIVLTARAEEAARTDLRESFDAAVSRAVAPMNILTELCAPFLRDGGIFAAWKGESFEEELSQAANAINTLGCRVFKTCPAGEGAIVILEKTKPAQDIYPRRFSKIKSSPL